jgi:hypothetical protein
MNALKTIAPLQQIAALAIAAVLTSGLLASLSAQADTTHAAALAIAQVNAQLACAAPQRAARS